MPRYACLFSEHKLKKGQAPSPDALAIDDGLAGTEIIATEDARNLAAFLVSSRAETPLFESPLPIPQTNAPAATGTNAPASGTNAPGTNAAPATNAAAQPGAAAAPAGPGK